jgi:hypothetical protein
MTYFLALSDVALDGMIAQVQEQCRALFQFQRELRGPGR